jgi:RNA polymerase sigma-70 factor (sigma-E family)
VQPMRWNQSVQVGVYRSVAIRRTKPATGAHGMGLGPDFDEFVNAYGTSLVRAAFLLTGDHGHSEDLVQVTLLRVARHWRVVRESPHAYSRRVLINLSRNYWRDRARRPRMKRDLASDEVAEDTQIELERIGDRILLRSALQQLPERQREVTVMRFILDLSVAETAALLKVPEGSVKSATHRSLASLRDYLHQRDEPLALEADRAD